MVTMKRMSLLVQSVIYNVRLALYYHFIVCLAKEKIVQAIHLIAIVWKDTMMMELVKIAFSVSINVKHVTHIHISACNVKDKIELL